MASISFSVAVAAPCKTQWGSAKVSGSATACKITARPDVEPSLIMWPLGKGGISGSKQMNFSLTISSFAALQGLEFRLYENNKTDKYISHTLPLFAEESFNWVQSKQETPVTLSLTHFLMGAKGAASYSKLGIFVQTKGDQALEVNFKNFAVASKKFPKGLVSITFDDGYESLKSADKILQAEGLKATAYIIREALGRKGYITAKEMCELAQRGWAISSHATPPFTDIKDLNAFVSGDIAGMKSDCGGKLFAEHLAYPLGQQNPAVLDVVKKYYKTARLAGSGPETLPPSENLRLRAVNVVPSMLPETILKMAQQAVENGDWLILMFHYIKPAGTEILNDLDYTENRFAELARGLKPLSASVVTVPEAFDKYSK